MAGFHKIIGRNRNAARTEYHRQSGAELITGPLNPQPSYGSIGQQKGSWENRRDRASACTIEHSRRRTNQSLGIHRRRFARFDSFFANEVDSDAEQSASTMLSPHKDGNAERGTASLLRRYDDVTLGGGSHGLFERRIAVAAGRAAADHSADRFVLAPLGKKAPHRGPFCCRERAKMARNRVCPAKHNLPTKLWRSRATDCPRFNESTRPIPGLGSGE